MTYEIIVFVIILKWLGVFAKHSWKFYSTQWYFYVSLTCNIHVSSVNAHALKMVDTHKDGWLNMIYGLNATKYPWNIKQIKMTFFVAYSLFSA